MSKNNSGEPKAFTIENNFKFWYDLCLMPEDTKTQLEKRTLYFKNINGCDLYLMSNFGIQQCEGIKGNAVILTNENTAYFIIEGKIVSKDEIPQAVGSINRQGIALSDSKEPTKYTVSKQKKEEVIKESTSKGGHTHINEISCTMIGPDDKEKNFSTKYELCLMSNQDEKDTDIQAGKIYIKKLNDHSALEYAVRGVDGKTIHRSLISVDCLGGWDLYLMSNFDIAQCEGMKGNAVILTNQNTAYFIIEGKIVSKEAIPQAVRNINRQGIEFSNAIRPTKYTVSEQKKEKVIKESTLKGGHTRLGEEFKHPFSPQYQSSIKRILSNKGHILEMKVQNNSLTDPTLKEDILKALSATSGINFNKELNRAYEIEKKCYEPGIAYSEEHFKSFIQEEKNLAAFDKDGELQGYLSYTEKKPGEGQCDLYLMSKFDSKQCKGIKGDAVILTNENGYSRVMMSSTFPKNLEAGTLYLTVDYDAKSITVQSTYMKQSKKLSESVSRQIYAEVKPEEDKNQTSIISPKIIHEPDLVDRITSLCGCTPLPLGENEIAVLSVIPSSQSCGLGKALLTELIKKTSDKLSLQCRPRLESYYQSFGFRTINAKLAYYKLTYNGKNHPFPGIDMEMDKAALQKYQEKLKQSSSESSASSNGCDEGKIVMKDEKHRAIEMVSEQKEEEVITLFNGKIKNEKNQTDLTKRLIKDRTANTKILIANLLDFARTIRRSTSFFYGSSLMGMFHKQHKEKAFDTIIAELERHLGEKEVSIQPLNILLAIINNAMLTRSFHEGYSRVVMSSTSPKNPEAGTLYLTVDDNEKRRITVQSTYMKQSKKLSESVSKQIYAEVKPEEDKNQISITSPNLVDRITSLCGCTLHETSSGHAAIRLLNQENFELLRRLLTTSGIGIETITYQNLYNFLKPSQYFHYSLPKKTEPDELTRVGRNLP